MFGLSTELITKCKLVTVKRFECRRFERSESVVDCWMQMVALYNVL